MQFTMKDMMLTIATHTDCVYTLYMYYILLSPRFTLFLFTYIPHTHYIHVHAQYVRTAYMYTHSGMAKYGGLCTYNFQDVCSVTCHTREL